MMIDMKYIAPVMKIEEAQAAKMLAESLGIHDDGSEIDGGIAKTKENFAWDIWADMD